MAASELPEDKIEKIRDEYRETGNVSDVAMKTGTPKSDVEKIVSDIEGSEDEPDAPEPEDTDESEPEEESPFGPAEDQNKELGLPERKVPDFSEQSPGRFLEWFFKSYNIDVKENFVNVISQHAEVNDAVPDENQLKSYLKDMSSGIGNSQTIDMVGEMYSTCVDRWEEENTPPRVPHQAQQPDGDWVDAGGARQPTVQRAQDDGSWVSPQDGQQPQQQPPGQPQQRGRPQSPQQPQQQAQPMGQMQQMMQQMMDHMDKQQQRMEEIVQKSQQSQNDRGGSGPTEQIQELVQMQEALDKLGDDGDGEMEQLANHLNQQFSALRQQLQDDSNDTIQDTDDVNAAVMAQLASRDDVDPGTITELASHLGGTTDPEVRKAEIQKEAELNKADKRKEMVEGIVGSGQQLGEALGGLMKAMGSAGQQAQPQAQQQMHQQNQAQQNAQPQAQQHQQQPDQSMQQTQPTQQQAQQQNQKPQGSRTKDLVRRAEEETEQSSRVVDGDEHHEDQTVGQMDEEMSTWADERAQDDPVEIVEDDGSEVQDGGQGGELPISPEEAAERYDTEDYHSFNSECSGDHGRDACIALWNALKEGGE